MLGLYKQIRAHWTWTLDPRVVRVQPPPRCP